MNLTLESPAAWERQGQISAPTTRSFAGPTVDKDIHFDRRWMSVVALCTALGLASVAVADAASRHGYAYKKASVFFWLGLLLTFVPIAVRVLMPGIDRHERLTLVIVLGFALYLVKVLASPDAFSFGDEYIHLRNTQDILRTHHLFAFNPLLPTAAYYPGLGGVTAGLVDLTGLSPFVSGVLIIGVARVLFSACFFLVAERVTESGRAAAGASLVYAANPMFLFWSAAFSYENLALPLAVCVIWWLERTRHGAGRPALTITAIAIIAVTVTHHVVGLTLTALLGAWWLVERLAHRPTAARRAIGLMTVVASTTTLAWLLFAARPAASYLFAHNLLPALQQTGSLLLGHTAPRRLYSSGGYASPEWETLAGFAAVGLLLLALPPALYLAWRRRYRGPMAVAIGVAAAYPLSLVPRLVPDGVAISGRASEYIFAGLACVLALLVNDVRPRLWILSRVQGQHYRRHHVLGTVATGDVVVMRRRGQHLRRRSRPTLVGWHKTVIATGLVTCVFIGDVTIGTAFYQRLPESSHAQGYPWSVQPDVVTAAKWARQHLGINQRFGANAIDASALATYGEQNTVGEDSIWPIFFALGVNGTAVRSIKTTGVRYLFVDWRMTKGVPATPGYYFSPQEPGAGQYRRRFPAAALQKFASAACTHLVYDSGAVQIFDVSRIENRSCAPVLTRTVRDDEAPG